MEPLVEHRPAIGGVRTRALELEGHGPPLVLLHGFADSADTWRAVLARLAREGRAAIALDLPGFGLADRLRPGPVLPQLDAFAAAAVAHVHAEHGAAPVVAGNSLGGALALRAAQRGDLPLAGVVPVAPAGLDMPAWFGVIERDHLLRALLALPTPVPELVVRTVVAEVYKRLAFHRPSSVEAAAIRAFTDHHATRRAVAGHLSTGRRLLPELTDCFELHRVGCPVLLVWGDRDRMVTHRGAQRVLAALPATQLELLEGIGHCPQVEAPDRLTALLQAFDTAQVPSAA
jgi:pimeloyl-ACP methyl ester carboxylesterase